MSVAARSVIPEPDPQKLPKVKRSSQKNSRTKVIKSSVPAKHKAAKSAWLSPLWLRSLLAIQKSSGAIAIVATLAVFSLYGKIVYTQQVWGKEYQKLKILQRQERNLTAANETLKNNLAEIAAQSETGLVKLDPQKLIFLTPVTRERQQKTIIKPQQQRAEFTPLGY